MKMGGVKRKREPRDRRARPAFGKVIWRNRPGKDDISLRRIIHALRPEDTDRVKASLIDDAKFAWTEVEILHEIPRGDAMADVAARYDVLVAWLREMFVKLEFNAKTVDACIESVRAAAASSGGIVAAEKEALKVWNQAQVTAVQARAASAAPAASRSDDEEDATTAEMIKRVLKEFP
jgi:hypothetical protein